MSNREEQCNKVCRILDDVLANRPAERDSLIIAVRKAFESLEQLGNSEPLPSAQPDLDEWCTDCKEYDPEKHHCPRFNRVIREALKDAEPERKPGEWELLPLSIIPPVYKCSACGRHAVWITTGCLVNRHEESYLSDFCPNCGADMRGEQNETD